MLGEAESKEMSRSDCSREGQKGSRCDFVRQGHPQFFCSRACQVVLIGLFSIENTVNTVCEP